MVVYICASLIHLYVKSDDLSQAEFFLQLLQAEQIPKMVKNVLLSKLGN